MLNFAVSKKSDNGSERISAAFKTVAEREQENITGIVETTRKLGARLIVGWADRGGSYQWLQRWAQEKGVAFANWGPLVDSVTVAFPEIPTTNNHSGGHYRTWVNTMIARAYAKEIRRLENFSDVR